MQIAVRADPGAAGDISGWTAALAAALSGGPSPADRAAASRAWWDAFWARSYFFTDANGPLPPPSGPRVGAAPCTGDAATQAVTVDAVTGVLTAPGDLCFYYSSGAMVRAPCTPSAPVWRVLPCAIGNCVAGDAWVIQNGTSTVWDMPGANCPWVDTYSQDVPPGQYKNQIFSVNETDSTLRTRCGNCEGQCMTVIGAPPPPPPNNVSLLAAQFARARYVQAIQARGTAVPIKL